MVWDEAANLKLLFIWVLNLLSFSHSLREEPDLEHQPIISINHTSQPHSTGISGSVAVDSSVQELWEQWELNFTMLKEVLLFTLGGAAIFTVGILIGHFGIDKGNSTPLPEWVREVAQDVDQNLIEKFIAQVDTKQLEENLQWVEAPTSGCAKKKCLNLCRNFTQLNNVTLNNTIWISCHALHTSLVTTCWKQVLNYSLKKYQKLKYEPIFKAQNTYFM